MKLKTKSDTNILLDIEYMAHKKAIVACASKERNGQVELSTMRFHNIESAARLNKKRVQEVESTWKDNQSLVAFVKDYAAKNSLEIEL